MITALLTILLAGYAPTEAKNAATCSQGAGADGGTAWSVYVAGQAAGSGGLTNTELRASPVPVSGTVSSSVSGTVSVSNPVTYVNAVIDAGSISVNNFPATQAVSLSSVPTHAVTQSGSWSNTCTQATGSNLHVVVDTAPTTAVTGTFFQATQPVSIAGTVATSLASTTITGSVATTQAASSISGQNPCVNPTATLSMVAGSTSGTASVQLIALSGSTRIYVCSMMIVGVSGTTPTFSLTYGTGSACASGNTVILGAFTMSANTVYNFGGGQFAATPAGQALCFVQTGTTPVARYVITYVQV